MRIERLKITLRKNDKCYLLAPDDNFYYIHSIMKPSKEGNVDKVIIVIERKK